ncbi:MAG: class I tRNA ligase family protein [SAR324 cluster bacterium]|nr:class I tRNA ligase family protein [SAR324 cluster bacterium]
MSKSKGNGLDPGDVIDGISVDDLVKKRTENLTQPRMATRIEAATRKEFPDGIRAYGTDPLRFTFYSIASQARTIRFDMKRVEGYRNFCNKLWNAANFVFMNTEAFDSDAERTLSVADRWIRSEFQKTAGAVNLAMETYRFDLAAKAIYEFVWDEFCDWYLELCKPVLNSDTAGPKELQGTKHTLLTVLADTLRLAHPFLPFITEEIWQKIPESIRGSAGTVMLQQYPEADKTLFDEDAVTDIAWIKEVVTGIRTIRGEMDIPLSKPIPVLFYNGDDNDKRLLEDYRALLTFLIKPEELTMLGKDASLPVSSTQLVGEMQLLVPMRDLIDKQLEIPRLQKEIDRLSKEQKRAEAKISNPDFVKKAPKAVVQKEKDKLEDISSALDKLQQQKTRIENL